MEMTTRERMRRILAKQEADRIPITDTPWDGAVQNWLKQGMPKGIDWRDYFGVDKLNMFRVDVSPRFERKIIEDSAEWRIETTEYGVTQRVFKQQDSTPEFLDYKITDANKWEEAKARMKFDVSRIDIPALANAYPIWQKQGTFNLAVFWFGFDITHSGMTGLETLLIAMYEDPDWVKDMFETYLDLNIKLYDYLWDLGYKFDAIWWYDDMGYKHSQFFSVNLYREILKPYHKRAVEWAKTKGMYAFLHSCGDVMPLVPELIEIGVDVLNPLEIKAGMDPFALKKQYGDKLTLYGGLDALKMPDFEASKEEIRKLVPTLKENGGYIFASDHSIPSNVSLETYKAIVEEVKRVGKY